MSNGVCESLVAVLDPGHGGHDGGGVAMGNAGIDLLVEKDWVLELGLYLSNRLGHLPGIQAPLTRDEDKNLGLDEAAKIAQEYGADLAICLHVNASPRTQDRGLMALFHPDGDWRAKDAAHAIAMHAPLFLRPSHPRATVASALYPGVRDVMGPYVTRKIPCVLVECGFASNNADRTYLLTKPGVQAVANAIEAGVIEFWRLSESKYAP